MSELIALLDYVQALLEKSLFEVFKEPKVAIGIALILLLAGVACVLWLVVRKWFVFYFKLRRLERVVRATDDELSFAEKFPSVDEELTSVNVVRHGWEEFKETLIFPLDDTSERIMNTSRPSDYINLAEAETSGLHLKFFQAVPNYFVGFGLLFTFLGLVAAIYFASQGIGAENNIARTQEHLKSLLNAATFKFLTSIAGILSSLLVGISYRLVAGSLQKKFDGLCEALEQRLVFATPESIAFEQYRELQQQTIQLERFNTDLAFSVADKLNEKLTQTLPTVFEKALAPLTATMNDMADRFGEMNQDAMSSMLEDFSKNLQQSAGTEMQAIGDGLNQTQQSLAGLVTGLQSASSQINETLSRAGQRLESAATTMEESIKTGLSESTSELQGQMGEISKRFHDEFTHSSAKFSAAMAGISRNAGNILQPMQEHLDGVTGRLDGLSSGLQRQIDSIGQLNDNLAILVRSTADASLRLQNAGEPVQKASEAIGNAALSLAATSQSTTQVQDKLSSLAETINDTAAKTSEQWVSYMKRFEQVDTDLANTFKVLNDGAIQQQTRVREFVTEVDTEFAKGLKNLAAGIESLHENLEEFTAAVDKLGPSLTGR